MKPIVSEQEGRLQNKCAQRYRSDYLYTLNFTTAVTRKKNIDVILRFSFVVHKRSW